MGNQKIKFNSFFEHNKIATTIWFGLVAIALLNAVKGDAINNFIIFKQSFFHLKNHTNLYVEYLNEYKDHYYYSPSFAVLVTPFVFLPKILAPFVWGFFDAWVLFYAIRKLPIQSKYQNFILILSANEMMNATANLQSNGIMAATIILAFVYLLKQKQSASALMMLVGFFIKLYSITGLAFFFFSKQKIKFILYFIFWSVVIFCLPLIIVSPANLIQCYRDWFAALSLKSNFDLTVPMHQNMVDITLQGMVKRIFDLPNLNKWLFILPALIIFGAQYLFYQYFKNPVYQLYILCSVLLFIIVFNTGTESPTFIIGVPAICLWYCLQHKTKWINTIFVVSIFLSSFSYSDIFTPWFRTHVMMPYALKALGCFIVWLTIAFQIYTKQFLQLSITKGE
jgi:Glycosyltransferase family 87